MHLVVRYLTLFIIDLHTVLLALSDSAMIVVLNEEVIRQVRFAAFRYIFVCTRRQSISDSVKQHENQKIASLLKLGDQRRRLMVVTVT